MNKRAVVTGMGVINPLGHSVDEYWQALLEGKSGISEVDTFDTTGYSTRIAASIKDFDPAKFIAKKEIKRTDRSQQLAVAASEEAIKDSRIDLEKINLERVGVIIGSGIGGIDTFEQQHRRLMKAGPGRVSPFFIPMMIIDMCAGAISIRYGFQGPNYGVVSACASSSHAIIDAYRIIQRGEADIIVAGGSEAPITPSAMAGFCSAKAMSTRNDDPQGASRPFDRGRDGFVMGEGAAILTVEELDHAIARGADIYAEIIGAGMTGDAHHMTAPHPEGRGAMKAMQLAIDDAGLQPEQIDLVNTHGTSTGLGDIAETKAIKNVLGEHAYKIACNSSKSMIGHLLGAAGASELVATIKSLQDGVLHPTVNLSDPDPECDLDYVPNVKRNEELNYAISNSFGFGGHNVTLAVGKYNSVR